MADRFYITSQMLLLPPSNLKQVVRDIKTEFKSIAKIETKISTPANLSEFRRKMKEVIKSVSDIELKVKYPTGIPDLKKKLNSSLRTATDVPIRLSISKSAELVIQRLTNKLKKAGTVSVTLNVPPGINATLKLLQSLQAKNGNININVKGNAASQINSINSSLKSTGKIVADTTSQIEKFGAQSAFAIRRYAAFTVVATSFYNLFAVIKNSISDAIAFEKELIKIRQVTGQATRDLVPLTDEVTRLSTGLGVSSQKLLNAAQTLAQAGYTSEQVTKSLETLAKTELSATFDDIQNSTEGLIAVMAQFQKEGKGAEEIFSSINSVSAKFAVESSDIITAIRRTGGAFAAAGGSINELIGLFTSVRATTRESAESIATGFRTIFTRLQRVRTQNFLKSLGLDLLKDGQFIGPFKAIEKLSEALAKIPSTDPRFAQITEELGGFRQISKVIPLVTQYSKAIQAYNVAQRSGNSLTEDAIKAQDSLANKFTKLKENLDAVVRSFTGSGFFRDTINGFISISNSILKVTDSMGGLITSLGLLGAVSGVGVLAEYGRGFLGVQKQGGRKITNQYSDPINPQLLNSIQNGGIAASVGNYLGKSNSNNSSPFRKQNTVAGGLVAGGILAGPLLMETVFKDISNEGKQVVDVLGNLATKIGLLLFGFTNFQKQLVNFNRGRLFNDISNLRGEQNRIRGFIGPLTPRQEARQAALGVSITAKINERKEIEKNVERFNKLGIATLALTALFSELGGFLDGLAKQSLADKNYSQFKTQASFAGAATGGANALLLSTPVAAILASFGALLSAGLVTVIAGLIGAITGYFIAAKKAEETKNAAIFKDDFDKTALLLNRINTGKSDAVQNIGLTESKFRLAKSRLINSQGASNESTRGLIESSLVDLDAFIMAVAKTKNSYEEVNAQLHDSIDIYTTFSNQTLSEYRKSIEDVIAKQKEQADSTIRVNETLERNIQRTREMTAMITTVRNVNSSLNDFADTLSQFDGLISGNVSPFKFEIGKDVLENLANVNNSRFNATTSSIGSFFGDAGIRLADEIKSIPDVINRLPSTLLKIATQNTFDEDKDFTQRFVNEFSDVPKALQDVLASQIDNLIGSEAKPDKLLDEIASDRFAVADKVAKALEQFINPFKDAAPVIEQLLTSIEDGMRKYRSLSLEIIERQGRIAETQFTRDSKLRDFNNIDGRANFDAQLSLNRSRLQALLGPNAGSINSPGTLAGRQVAIRRQIQGIDETLRSNPSANDYTNLIRQRTELTEELARVTKGLETLGDAAYEAAILENKYNYVREQNQAKRDVVKDYTFGTNESRFQMDTTFAAIAQLTKTQDIESIPETLRADVQAMLEKMGTAEVFGVRADELLKNIQVNFLKNRFGFTEDQARQQVEATQEEKDLQRKIIEAYNRTIEAQKATTESLVVSQGDLRDAILLWIEAVKFEREAGLLGSQQKELERTGTDIKGKKSVVQEQANLAEKLSGELGFDLTTGNNIGLLKNNLDLIAKLKRDEEKKTNIAGANLDNFGNDELDRGVLVQKIRQRLGENFTLDDAKRIANTQGYMVGDYYVDTETARANELEKIKQEKLKSLNDEITVGRETLGTTFSSEQIDRLIPKIDELNKIFKDGLLGDSDSFQGLMDSIKNYTEELSKNVAKIQELQKQLDTAKQTYEEAKTKVKGGEKNFAVGGKVHGSGVGDTVPAMLTPGEYVLNKKAVQAIGVDKLNRMNHGKVQKFADGGYVQLNPFVGGKENKQLLEFIGKANKLLKPLGLTVQDVFNDKIFAQEGLTTSKGVSARGIFSAGGRTGVIPPNSVILNPQAAGVSTVLEETLHGIDMKSSGQAKDFITSSALEKNPMARIAKLFHDKSGIAAIAEAEGLNLRDAATQRYLNNPSERFAKTFKHLLKGGKGLETLEKLVPEKVAELRKALPELASYINKPTIANRVGVGSAKVSDVHLPVLTGPEIPNEKAALDFFGKSKSTYNPKVGLGTLAKRAAGKAGSSILNSTGKTGKSIITGAGKVINSSTFQRGSMGAGAGLVTASSASDLYQGKVGSAATNTLNYSLPGFLGNIAGNALNNVGSYLGTGAETVPLFGNNLGSGIDDILSVYNAETQVRNARYNDRRIKREVEQENKPFREKSKAENRIARAQANEFAKEQTAKQIIADDKFSEGVMEQDRVKKELYGPNYTPKTIGRPTTVVKEIESDLFDPNKSTKEQVKKQVFGTPRLPTVAEIMRGEHSIATQENARQIVRKSSESSPAVQKADEATQKRIEEENKANRRERERRINSQDDNSVRDRLRESQERIQSIKDGTYVNPITRVLGDNNTESPTINPEEAARRERVAANKEIVRRAAAERKRIKEEGVIRRKAIDVSRAGGKTATVGGNPLKPSDKKPSTTPNSIPDVSSEPPRAPIMLPNGVIVNFPGGFSPPSRKPTPKKKVKPVTQPNTGTKDPFGVGTSTNPYKTLPYKPGPGNPVMPLPSEKGGEGNPYRQVDTSGMSSQGKAGQGWRFGSDRERKMFENMSPEERDKAGYQAARLIQESGMMETGWYNEKTKKMDAAAPEDLRKRYKDRIDEYEKRGQGTKDSPKNKSGGGGDCPCDMDLFSKSVGIFNTAVGDLSKVLNAFPHTIQLEANHRVEVIFNGAEVLNSLLPQIQTIAVSKAEEALEKYTQKNNMPPIDKTTGGNQPKTKKGNNGQ